MTKLVRIIPVLMCREIDRSIAFYRSLGFEATFVDSPDDPKYACVERDGVELHLQWHDVADFPAGIDRPTYRFPVDDVDGLSAEFRRAIEVRMNGPMRTSWGTYEFHVQDPDLNGLQFFRYET